MGRGLGVAGFVCPVSIRLMCGVNLVDTGQRRQNLSWAWFFWLRWYSNQGNGPAHPFQALELGVVISSAPAKPGLRPVYLYHYRRRELPIISELISLL